MITAISISRLTELGGDTRQELIALLVAVVDDGASIGFLPPLGREEATRYWCSVLAPGVVLLVAEQRGRVVGSAQLHESLRPNGSHRAEVVKLMVHPEARRQGLGRRLMERLEEIAGAEGRSLLVLDTRAGDPSNELYLALGYVEYGRVPRYARSANGELDECVFYYKELAWEPDGAAAAPVDRQFE